MTRPESWIHLFKGLLSIKRHFRVDWTNPSIFRTLLGSVQRLAQKMWGKGAFSPRLKIAKIASHLLCASLSGPGFDGPVVWVQQNEVILLLPPLQNQATRSARADRTIQGEERRTMGYAIRCLPGAIHAVICGCSTNSRNSGSCIIKEVGTVAR